MNGTAERSHAQPPVLAPELASDADTGVIPRPLGAGASSLPAPTTSAGTVPVSASPHTVEGVHYNPGNAESRIECRCGARLKAATPELLAAAWDKHRGKRSTSQPAPKPKPTPARCGVGGCDNRKGHCYLPGHNPTTAQPGRPHA